MHWLLWVFMAVLRLSPVAGSKQGLPNPRTSCGVWASHLWHLCFRAQACGVQ